MYRRTEEVSPNPPSACEATHWWALLWSLAQPLEHKVAEWKDPSVNGDVYFYGSFMNIRNRTYVAIYTVYGIQ